MTRAAERPDAATAVTVTADGWLTDVDLGDPDLRPEHPRRLTGCAAVHAVALSADLDGGRCRRFTVERRRD